MKINGDYLYFDTIAVSYDLESIYDDETDISGRDEDYLSAFGITVDVPEDAIEDSEFHLSVPEEQVEGAISVVLSK